MKALFSGLVAALLLASAAGSEDELSSSIERARRTYDLTAAVELRQQAREAARAAPTGPASRLLAGVCLLEAELRRIEFEATPESKREERRAIGALIDEAAQEGLDRVESLEPDSELLRMRADLLGTLIRSKYRGKKYRRRMETAAKQALELDPENALAWVSLAKPPLFRPGRDPGDLRTGLDLLSRALELDTDLEPARVLRGRALAELGRVDAAITEWRHALRINPDSVPARELLEEHE